VTGTLKGIGMGNLTPTGLMRGPSCWHLFLTRGTKIAAWQINNIAQSKLKSRQRWLDYELENEEQRE